MGGLVVLFKRLQAKASEKKRKVGWPAVRDLSLCAAVTRDILGAGWVLAIAAAALGS